MAKNGNITTLFLDIGGVLLTNGWDRQARTNAIRQFNLDNDEVNERHHLTFDTYEVGKISLDDYLDRVIFYEKRNFTKKDFKEFMFAQSQMLPDMIDYIKILKLKHSLRVTAVSNEGRELTEHRIEKFKLYDLFDSFVASSFVHFRKPDVDIFKLALDISQASPKEVVYIDDRHMFVEVAGTVGIRGIHHISFASTKEKLAEFGLS